MKEKIISLVNLVSLFFQKLFLLMIRFYQAAISPHLGKTVDSPLPAPSTRILPSHGLADKGHISGH